jgi:hypothetical protein
MRGCDKEVEEVIWVLCGEVNLEMRALQFGLLQKFTIQRLARYG